MVRGLGDHNHFAVPVWRDLLTRLGVVRGTRENCGRLFAAGEAVLVFPGGGREVFKHKGEKYVLVWKERVGFAQARDPVRRPHRPLRLGGGGGHV